jgi:hypothetical protein
MAIHDAGESWVLETRNTGYALGVNRAGLVAHHVVPRDRQDMRAVLYIPSTSMYNTAMYSGIRAHE